MFNWWSKIAFWRAAISYSYQFNALISTCCELHYWFDINWYAEIILKLRAKWPWKFILYRPPPKKKNKKKKKQHRTGVACHLLVVIVLKVHMYTYSFDLSAFPIHLHPMLLLQMDWLTINRYLVFLIYSFVVIFCTFVSTLETTLATIHETVRSVDMTHLQPYSIRNESIRCNVL